MPFASSPGFQRFILPTLLVAALLLIRWQFGMLLFHTLAELFSAMVGILMLVIAWNTRRFTRNDFLLYLGIGYFWIALLDVCHTFTVAGLPFFEFSDSQVTLHLWIYTRFVEASLLLSAPLMLRHKLHAGSMMLVGAIIFVVIVWTAFSFKAPTMLTAQGLTPFKVGMEYLIMAMLALAFVIYQTRRQVLTSEVTNYLLISIGLTFFAEFSFTLYDDFFGIPFVVGHIFKFLSFWMIYQAIVHTTLARPFAVLASHSTSYNAIPHAAVVVDQQGMISQLNQAAERFADQPASALLHTHIHDKFHSAELSRDDCPACRAISSGTELQGLEIALPQNQRWYLLSLSSIRIAGEHHGMVQLLTDISARKRVEQALEVSEQRFRQLFEHTDAIAVQGYNRQRQVIYWNPASVNLYGYSEQQALGKRLEDLIIPPDMRSAVIAGIDDWLDGGPAIPSAELSLQRADGSVAHVYSSHVLIRNAQGETEMFCIDIDLSASREARLALESQERRLSQILRTLPNGVQENELNGLITYANEALHHIYGQPAGTMVGRYIWDFETDRKRRQTMKDYFKNIVQQQPTPEPYVTENYFANTGEVKIIEVIWDYQRDQEGRVSGFVSVISDITARKKSETALLDSEQRFQDFAEAAADLFWENDADLRFSYISGKAENLLGVESAEVIGKSRAEIYRDQNFVNEPWFQLHLQTLKQHKPFANFELRLERDQGPVFMQISGNPRFDDDGNFIGYRGATRDITEQKMVEQKVVHQAHFDALTELPNRFLSLDRLAQMLYEAKRIDQGVAVIFLDLDDFKKVNDSLGHEIGDKLLIDAAHRLQQVVRKGDTVGRLGGDEFIVLLGGLNKTTDALPIIDNLLNGLRESFRIEGRELILSGSIGVALYPQDGNTPSELLRNADSAMYHAKEMGRNTYSFFTEEMNLQVSRRLAIEEQIHGALGRGEFSIFYQAKVDVASQQVVGAEALLRWNNPALGAVSPLEFIPIAEQTGLIVPIGQFVLVEALACAKRWREQLREDFCIAVNLSPRQFRDPELVHQVSSALESSAVPPSALELEITEGVLMSGHDYIDKALSAIKALGVTLAMDDFGTGYSSLSYLRNYPFDVLKIDQSFVRDITEDPADRELINAAIAMAHSLRLRVVAEGVETDEQLQYLKQLECDYLQGYLFGKPMSAEDFEQHIRADRLS